MISDKFLDEMETEYDYQETKGSLFKIRHLKVTIEDYGWRKWKSTPNFPPKVKEDYDYVIHLEKRLMENSHDGYGYPMNKVEMKTCNNLYGIYRKSGGVLWKAPFGNKPKVVK